MPVREGVTDPLHLQNTMFIHVSDPAATVSQMLCKAGTKSLQEFAWTLLLLE